MRDVNYRPPCMTPLGNYEVHILTGTDQPKTVENAPCHVQLIGRRLKDEVLMQHAQIVEAILTE